MKKQKLTEGTLLRWIGPEPGQKPLGIVLSPPGDPDADMLYVLMLDDEGNADIEMFAAREEATGVDVSSLVQESMEVVEDGDPELTAALRNLGPTWWEKAAELDDEEADQTWESDGYAHRLAQLRNGEEPVSFDDFKEQAIDVIQRGFSEPRDPGWNHSPVLLLAFRGRIDMIAWNLISTESQEHFLDRVVPETLAAHDAEMVALGYQTSLRDRDSEGSPGPWREAVLLNYVELMSEGESRELFLNATVTRRPDSSPHLEAFERIGDSLMPAVADGIYKGINLRLQDPQ